MKTTLELPDSLFRRAKTAAAEKGMTLKQLFTEALESRLEWGAKAGGARAAKPRWLRAYGALRHLRSDRTRIERAIEAEFETVEAEDQKWFSIPTRSPRHWTRMPVSSR